MKNRFSALGLLTISGIVFSLMVSTSFKPARIDNCQFSYLRYDVEIQDKYVGWMTCSKNTLADQSVSYTIDSKVNINIITSYDIQFKQESSFKNGSLLKSNYFTKVNGDTQSFSRLNWDGTRYIGWDGKKNSVIDTNKIGHSIGNLYFKEPVGSAKIFSEKYLTICPITKSGEYYTIRFPDDKATCYKYQNGICVWAESKQKLYKIVFRLKEIK